MLYYRRLYPTRSVINKDERLIVINVIN